MGREEAKQRTCRNQWPKSLRESYPPITKQTRMGLWGIPGGCVDPNTMHAVKLSAKILKGEVVEMALHVASFSFVHIELGHLNMTVQINLIEGAICVIHYNNLCKIITLTHPRAPYCLCLLQLTEKQLMNRMVPVLWRLVKFMCIITAWVYVRAPYLQFHVISALLW